MRRILLLLPLLAALSAAPARADDTAGEDRIIFGLSEVNPLGEQSYDYRYGFRMELRLGSVHIWKLHPWAGMDIYPDSAGFWGGGLETDIDLSDEWVTTLQTGAGYLDDGTDFYNIQAYPPSGFEFRSQVELAYKFKGGGRFGVAVSHISNAGLREENPGIAILSFNAHIPMAPFAKPAKPLR